VYVPLDSAALALGADAVATEIARVADQRGVSIEVVRTGSRGMIWAEPLVEVDSPAGRVGYAGVAVGDVERLFDVDFLLSEQGGGADTTALGLVDEIPYLAGQQRLSYRRCGVVDPLSLEDYRAHGGLRGLEQTLELATVQIVDEIIASGLRGRGGAAFRAGIKWKTVADQPASQKFVVCNADEGDSGTFADRIVMEGDPYSLIEGMIIAGLAVGADRGFIYLRSEYPVAARILSAALERAYQAGVLGGDVLGSGRRFELELFIGAGSYICGEETAMLESLEGKRGQVRAKPPLPAIEGLFGEPTLIHNVVSLIAVPDILAEGGAIYRAHGVNDSRGTMPFQLAGNIARGGLVELPFGVTLRELIETFGGATQTGRPIRAVQIGGPLGAYLSADLLDTPLDYEAMAALGAGIGHGGVVVFDDTVDLAEQARYAFEFCAHESCGKCTPCRVGAVRGEETLAGVLVARELVSAGRSVESLIALTEDLCEVMEDASLCAMGSMTPIPVRSAMRYFPEDFGAQRRNAD
jgi:formate dehydrogenase iron-sulfur subunit